MKRHPTAARFTFSDCTSRSVASLAGVLLLVSSTACTRQLVTLAPVPSLPATQSGAQRPVEVVGIASSGVDPLSVSGTNLVFDGLPRAVAEYVTTAAAPWGLRHLSERPGGWQMLIELVRGEADAGDGHLAVALEARVTLRTRAGQEHIGQTSGYCRVREPLAAYQPARIVYLCIERMSRDIASWLERLHP